MKYGVLGKTKRRHPPRRNWNLTFLGFSSAPVALLNTLFREFRVDDQTKSLNPLLSLLPVILPKNLWDDGVVRFRRAGHHKYSRPMMSFGYLCSNQIAGRCRSVFNRRTRPHALSCWAVFCVLRRLSGGAIALIAQVVCAAPIHTRIRRVDAPASPISNSLLSIAWHACSTCGLRPVQRDRIRAAMCGCWPSRCFRRTGDHTPCFHNCSSTLPGDSGGLPPPKSFRTGRSGDCSSVSSMRGILFGRRCRSKCPPRPCLSWYENRTFAISLIGAYLWKTPVACELPRIYAFHRAEPSAGLRGSSLGSWALLCGVVFCSVVAARPRGSFAVYSCFPAPRAGVERAMESAAFSPSASYTSVDRFCLAGRRGRLLSLWRAEGPRFLRRAFSRQPPILPPCPPLLFPSRSKRWCASRLADREAFS